MTVTAEIDPDNPERVLIASNYTDEYLVTQLPGNRHDRKRSQAGTVVHTIPRTWASWMALQGVFMENPCTIGPQFQAWLQEEWETRVQPCLALRTQTDLMCDPNTPWDADLLPFQRPGVAMMAIAGQAVLADEMGTGKTVQTICTIRRLHTYGLDPFPVLCIVPNTTKGNWRREWETWFPGLRVQVVGNGAKERGEALGKDADVYVINWDAVMLESRLTGYGSIRLKRCKQCDRRSGDEKLPPARCEVHPKVLNQIPWKTVVVDEAHMMKNPAAKRTRAVWSVQRGKDVRFCYALTGTPIGDTPDDLWPIMHGLHPTEYPDRGSYVERYCLQSWNYRGELEIIGINPNTRGEFFGFFDARFRRMPKALVMPFLPPVVNMTRDCAMTPKQTKMYRDMEKHMMAEVEQGLVTSSNTMVRDMRLLQFASATCELDEQGNVTMKMPSSKVNAVLEVMEEAGKPVAVAASSRKLIELTSSVLEKQKPPIPHHVLVGGLTGDQRDKMIDDLQASRIRALLFTVKTGGIGVNMTAADTLIRMDRSWSMLENYQLTARVHRYGSQIHDSITVVDLVAPVQKELDQFRALGRKTARLEEITRDKVTLREAGRLAEVAALDAEEHAILNSTLLPE